MNAGDGHELTPSSSQLEDVAEPRNVINEIAEKCFKLIPEPQRFTGKPLCYVRDVQENFLAIIHELRTELDKDNEEIEFILMDHVELLFLLRDEFEEFEQSGEDIDDAFHQRLHQQLMLDKFRRCPVATVAFAICCSEESDSATIFNEAAEIYEIWANVTYNPDIVEIDPDLLPESIFAKHLTLTAKESEVQAQTCAVCDSTLTFSTDLDQRLPSDAISTLCNHVFCVRCLDMWRKEGMGGKFTCPMCRACLVCQKSNCAVHCVPEEKARPVPLLDVLDPDRQDGFVEKLGGQLFQDLRERTRASRVNIAFYQSKLTDESLTKDQRSAFTNSLHYHENQCLESVATSLKRHAETIERTIGSRNKIIAQGERIIESHKQLSEGHAGLD